MDDEALAVALQRLAAAQERANELNERQLAIVEAQHNDAMAARQHWEAERHARSVADEAARRAGWMPPDQRMQEQLAELMPRLLRKILGEDET